MGAVGYGEIFIMNENKTSGAILFGEKCEFSDDYNELNRKLPNPITQAEIDLAIKEGRFREASRMIFKLYVVGCSGSVHLSENQIIY